MEMLLVGIILMFILEYNNKISANKFVQDNEQYFRFLKESDYEFLVRAKYGDKVDPSVLFMKRIRLAGIVIVALIFIFLSNLSFLNVIAAFVVGYIVFKSEYSSLKKYYKAHLHEIDLLLPYYLKSLEILVHHYTVPVAIAKSIDDAPDIFKSGLRDLTAKINAGDSSIDPYMEFAQEYPVRDSMRMMRLLYRLGLGSQEKKYIQLLAFSKTVSNLQAKSREQKYKERLTKMENKTLTMLVCTGAGTMILLLISIFMLMRV